MVVYGNCYLCDFYDLIWCIVFVWYNVFFGGFFGVVFCGDVGVGWLSLFVYFYVVYRVIFFVFCVLSVWWFVRVRCVCVVVVVVFVWVVVSGRVREEVFEEGFKVRNRGSDDGCVDFDSCFLREK